MKYLSVHATGGVMTIDRIPFERLEFTHDIDSLKDLCTSLVKIESTVDEWDLIRIDAKHYLSTLSTQTCSPKMLEALGDSLMDSLANFKATPIEGELIISIIERGSVVYELTEAGGITHIDHVHEVASPCGKKRPLREAFAVEQLTLKMPWQPRVTDIDVLSQLARAHGIDNLGMIVGVSNDVPGDTRLSHFTLVADQYNDTYHGSYTVNIEWTGRRPQRSAARAEPVSVKEDIDQLLGADTQRELTVHPDSSPSAAELYADLLSSVDVELPRMPLFMPVVWPKDMRDKPTKVQLYVSPEDDTYTGDVWVIINWRTSVTIEGRVHLSSMFDGVENHKLILGRRTSITADDVYAALCKHASKALPGVKLNRAGWKIRLVDFETLVEITVSPEDDNFYGSLRVRINWV